MEWLQVIGYPQYFVNKDYEVRGPKGLMKGAIIALRRKGRAQLSIKRKRLYLLTKVGLDPYMCVNSGVDVVEIEGGLRLMEWKERRQQSAIRQHIGAILTVDESKQYFVFTINWADACIKAIDGDTSLLWDILTNVQPKIDDYLLFQCCVTSRKIRQEIIQETFTLYVERVVQCKSQCCNIRALKRMARGLLEIFNKTVPKY